MASQSQRDASPDYAPLFLSGESPTLDHARMNDALPVAMYATDVEGQITYFNAAAAEMWGRSPEIGEEFWCGSWKLYWPDGTPLPHEKCPMAEVLKTGRAIRGVEAVLERPDGTRVSIIPYPTPLFDDAGELIGALNVFMETGDRGYAESATQRLAAIVGSSEDAIISKTLDGKITTWNEAAERLFGYTADEAIGKSIEMLIPPDRLNEEPEIINQIRQGHRVEHFETLRRRKDGSLIDISLRISPIRDAKGKIIGASKIARDITERKKAEETKILLLNELKHRVKNTLGTVQGLAAQSYRGAPQTQHQAFNGRLTALAQAHDLLTDGHQEDIELWTLLQRALAPFEDKHKARFNFDGPNVSLRREKCLSLSLAMHELATNATKYGALSNEVGTVHLSWGFASDRAQAIRIEWRERGGPLVNEPTHRGFGTTLLAHTFGSATEIQFAPDGVVCRLLVTL